MLSNTVQYKPCTFSLLSSFQSSRLACVLPPTLQVSKVHQPQAPSSHGLWEAATNGGRRALDPEAKPYPCSLSYFGVYLTGPQFAHLINQVARWQICCSPVELKKNKLCLFICHNHMCLYTWEKGEAWDGGGGGDSLGASHGPINCGQGGGVNTTPAPPIPLAPPTPPAHPQLQQQHGLPHRSPRDRQEEVWGKYRRMVLLVSTPLPPRPSLPADWQ